MVNAAQIAQPSLEDEMRLALDRERRQAARLPNTERTPKTPGPQAAGRLEGEALQQSLADVRPEQFGANQSAVDLARNRRDLDAARSARSPSLPTTFPSGADLAAQEGAEEEMAQPEQESRLSRLLQNVREQANRAFGQSTEGVPAGTAAGIAGAAAAPAIAAAERGYGLAWDQLQGWLETLAFTWVGMLIAGPASLAAYVVRGVGGHVVRPKVRGVQVIPPYTITSFVAHTLPNVLIVIALGILTLLIMLIVDLVTNKCDSTLVQTVTSDFLGGILQPIVKLLSFAQLC